MCASWAAAGSAHIVAASSAGCFLFYLREPKTSFSAHTVSLLRERKKGDGKKEGKKDTNKVRFGRSNLQGGKGREKEKKKDIGRNTSLFYVSLTISGMEGIQEKNLFLLRGWGVKIPGRHQKSFFKKWEERKEYWTEKQKRGEDENTLLFFTFLLSRSDHHIGLFFCCLLPPTHLTSWQQIFFENFPPLFLVLISPRRLKNPQHAGCGEFDTKEWKWSLLLLFLSFSWARITSPTCFCVSACLDSFSISLRSILKDFFSVFPPSRPPLIFPLIHFVLPLLLSFFSYNVWNVSAFLRYPLLETMILL